MHLKNTPEAYGAVTKTLHWLIALAFIFMLGLGLVMSEMPNAPGTMKTKFALYDLHKALGITILALAFLRILWHIISKRPGDVPTLSRAERVLAHLMHYGLYFLMLALPLSGWVMSSAAGRPVHVFGLFTMPAIAAPDEALSKLARGFHGYAAYAAMAAVALHFAAALKHHFISRDAVLRRMLPALMLLVALPASARAATNWEVNKADSVIFFTAKAMDKSPMGELKDYAADIAFSPEDLAGSRAHIVFKLAGIEMKDKEALQNLQTKDFLDTAAFPEAVFDAKTFAKAEDGFTAQGTLKIKDVSAPVTLDFRFMPEGDTASAAGHATLDRQVWKLGTGEWADPSIIANNIGLEFRLSVHKAR